MCNVELNIIPLTCFRQKIGRYEKYREDMEVEMDILLIAIKLLVMESLLLVAPFLLQWVYFSPFCFCSLCILQASLCFGVSLIWLEIGGRLDEGMMPVGKSSKCWPEGHLLGHL